MEVVAKKKAMSGRVSNSRTTSELVRELLADPELRVVLERIAAKNPMLRLDYEISYARSPFRNETYYSKVVSN